MSGKNICPGTPFILRTNNDGARFSMTTAVFLPKCRVPRDEWESRYVNMKSVGRDDARKRFNKTTCVGDEAVQVARWGCLGEGYSCALKVIISLGKDDDTKGLDAPQEVCLAGYLRRLNQYDYPRSSPLTVAESRTSLTADMILPDTASYLSSILSSSQGEKRILPMEHSSWI